MDRSNSSSDESNPDFQLEASYNSQQNKIMKVRKNRTIQSKRFPNMDDYQWMRKVDVSPFQTPTESRTNSNRSSKKLVQLQPNSRMVATSETNELEEIDGQEHSSGNEEFTHCDCTTCQEARFIEYQASRRARPRLKTCEAKVDITNAGKGKFVNVNKRKLVNPIIDRTVTKRLASANRDTINSLKGQINCLEIKIKELQKENAAYKLIQYRQEKALTRYQGEFAELPTLIKNHKEELQGCRQLLKKAENKCRDLEETIKIRDKRIGKLQEENYKLGSFVNQYDMGNRYKLLTQLKETKTKLRETEKKAEESSHHLQVLQKSQQQRLRQDTIKMKKADENLYKASMRNVELRKYIEDQNERLKTYETLLVKTIRQNNLPVDMEGHLRNENANRPKTYVLATEANHNLVICKTDESLAQEAKSQYNITNTDTRISVQSQQIAGDTQPFSLQSNKESYEKIINFEEEDEVPTETLYAYQCKRDSESSLCPTDNCLPEREKIRNGIDYQEKDSSFLSIHRQSGGDQESIEKSVSKEENNSRKNRYDAGDEAGSNSVSFADSVFIDGVHQDRNSGTLCTYQDYNNQERRVEEENSFEVLLDEEGRNSKKMLQLQKYKNNGKQPFLKISEEYIEKYVVDGKGRNKKSMAIMKKRKNAIFHPLPMTNSTSKSQIIQLNHNGDGLFMPYMNASFNSDITAQSNNISGVGNQTSLNCVNYEFCHPETCNNSDFGRNTNAFVSHSR